MKIYTRPTREGLWHPVTKDGTVMWPVEVEIIPARDPETGEKTRKRIISTYTFGTEERRDQRACTRRAHPSRSPCCSRVGRLRRGPATALAGVHTREPREAAQCLRDTLLRHLEERGSVAPGAPRGSERGSYQRVARDVGDGGDAVGERQPLRYDREKVRHEAAPRTPAARTVCERGAAVAADGALSAAAHARAS